MLYANVDKTAEQSDAGYGFIVSKAVGKAVVRNRVKRRLRALATQSILALPERTRVVVRALPAAADSDWQTLHAEHEKALAACLRKIREQSRGQTE